MLGALPGPVAAHDTAVLQVRGVVAQSCAVSGPSGAQPISLALPAHSAGASTRVPFDVACNTPFLLSARSLAGALSPDAGVAPLLGGDLVRQVSYGVAITVTTDDPAAPLALSCDAAAMAATEGGCAVSSGAAAATGPGAGQGSLVLTIPDGQRPVRGTYQDTIILAVTAW